MPRIRAGTLWWHYKFTLCTPQDQYNGECGEEPGNNDEVGYGTRHPNVPFDDDGQGVGAVSGWE